MGISAFKAVRVKSDGNGEASKVEGAAAVEVVGRYRVLRDFSRGSGIVMFLWQEGQGNQGSPGCFSVCSCVAAHIGEG